MNQSVRELIGKEREIAPIIEKCVDSIEEAVNEVVPEADTAMVAEKYKVNKIPPAFTSRLVAGKITGQCLTKNRKIFLFRFFIFAHI